MCLKGGYVRDTDMLDRAERYQDDYITKLYNEVKPFRET